MFSSPRGGNLHPSVLNKSQGLGQGSLPSALSPGANSGLESRGIAANSASVDIDEAEARMRAREILQDFVRQKNKSQDVEQQLQRALQDNERLSHNLEEHRLSQQLEKEKHMREFSNLKADRGDTETRIQIANEEIQRVAKAAAQRAADSASHLRVKEQEIESMESELVASREEIYRLRQEVLRLKEDTNATDEVAKSQQKVVELARKLLDVERTKTNLEQELLADRKHHQQSLMTIESLRKQCADTDEKVKVVENQRDQDKNDFQTTIDTLHKEMELQREMYKDFMQQLSAGGKAGSQNANAELSEKNVENSVLNTKLKTANEANEVLQRQIATVAEELDVANKSLFEERARRIDDVGALRAELQRQEAVREEHERKVTETREAARKEHDQLVQLIGIHEETKKEQEAQTANFNRAHQQLRELVRIQEVLKTDLQQLRDEAKTKDAAVTQLTEALKSRQNNEMRVREMQILHNHEKELLRLQMAKGSAVVTAAATPVAAAAPAVSSEELERFKDKISQMETEREKLQAEKSAIIHASETEKSALIVELRGAKEGLENIKIENAQLKSHALHAQREVEEWRSAFHMAERAKHKVQQQLEDSREVAQTTLQDRNAVDTRMQLLTQHVNRLEAQAERDSQELFRVRRELANAEVTLARREVDIKGDEVNRIMALRPDNAAAQLEKEKELMRLRNEKDRREKELQQKEITAQQLHESQLRLLSQSAVLSASPSAIPPPHHMSSSSLPNITPFRSTVAASPDAAGPMRLQALGSAAPSGFDMRSASKPSASTSSHPAVVAMVANKEPSAESLHSVAAPTMSTSKDTSREGTGTPTGFTGLTLDQRAYLEMMQAAASIGAVPPLEPEPRNPAATAATTDSSSTPTP